MRGNPSRRAKIAPVAADHPLAAELSSLGFDPRRQSIARELRLLWTKLFLARYALLFLTASLLSFVSGDVFGAILSAIRPRWLGVLVYTYAVLTLVHWPTFLIIRAYLQRWKRLARPRRRPSLPRFLLQYLGLILVGIPVFAYMYGMSFDPWQRVSWDPILYVAFVTLAEFLSIMGSPVRGRTDEALRERAIAVGKRLGIKPKHVRLRITRGESALGAFVILGPWYSIVLTDEILRLLTQEELDAIIAHELAHQRMAWAMGLPLIPKFMVPVLFVGFLLGKAAPFWSMERFEIPVLPLFLALVEAGLLLSRPVANPILRWLERRADALGLRATGDPRTFARAMAKLYDHEAIDAAPGRLWQVLLSSHPRGIDRVRRALEAASRKRDLE
jgi:Zn-dependent protease with chaperone function